MMCDGWTDLPEAIKLRIRPPGWSCNQSELDWDQIQNQTQNYSKKGLISKSKIFLPLKSMGKIFTDFNRRERRPQLL